jgi:hypothetical protein
MNIKDMLNMYKALPTNIDTGVKTEEVSNRESTKLPNDAKVSPSVARTLEEVLGKIRNENEQFKTSFSSLSNHEVNILSNKEEGASSSSIEQNLQQEFPSSSTLPELASASPSNLEKKDLDEPSTTDRLPAETPMSQDTTITSSNPHSSVYENPPQNPPPTLEKRPMTLLSGLSRIRKSIGSLLFPKKAKAEPTPSKMPEETASKDPFEILLDKIKSTEGLPKSFSHLGNKIKELYTSEEIFKNGAMKSLELSKENGKILKSINNGPKKEEQKAKLVTVLTSYREILSKSLPAIKQFQVELKKICESALKKEKASPQELMKNILNDLGELYESPIFIDYSNSMKSLTLFHQSVNNDISIISNISSTLGEATAAPAILVQRIARHGLFFEEIERIIQKVNTESIEKKLQEKGIIISNNELSKVKENELVTEYLPNKLEEMEIKNPLKIMEDLKEMKINEKFFDDKVVNTTLKKLKETGEDINDSIEFQENQFNLNADQRLKSIKELSNLIKVNQNLLQQSKNEKDVGSLEEQLKSNKENLEKELKNMYKLGNPQVIKEINSDKFGRMYLRKAQEFIFDNIKVKLEQALKERNLVKIDDLMRSNDNIIFQNMIKEQNLESLYQKARNKYLGK